MHNNEHGKIRKNVKLTAGFRKYFNTQLVYADVNSKVKEMLMGHSLGLDDNYFKPGENKILQEYLKAVDYLTINEENRLRKELGCEKQKGDELSKVKQQFNIMKSQIGALISTLGNMDEITKIHLQNNCLIAVCMRKIFSS